MSVYAFNSLYSKLYNLEVDDESVERVKKNKCGDRMLVLRFTVGDLRLRDCLSVFFAPFDVYAIFFCTHSSIKLIVS